VKTVVNRTIAPLKIALPRGKSLRLGPNGSGRIRDEDAEHKPLQKLVASGDIEIDATGVGTRGVAGRGFSGRGEGKPNVRNRESSR
jgi:hypothetical protein